MTRQQTQWLVAIDIGNSHFSAALFGWDGVELPTMHDAAPTRFSHQEFPGPSWSCALEDWAALGELQWFISSVHQPFRDTLVAWLQRERPGETVVVLTHEDVPLVMDVSHPQQVGMDRLAAAVAVNQRRSPGVPALIVDCGTAVTCDLVSGSGVFLGGAILPGWHLAMESLAARTDQLPLVDHAPSPCEAVGKSTGAAISSGVYWGTLGALRELVIQMSKSCSTVPDKFLSGAGAIWAEHLVQQDGFEQVSDLVLTGVALSGIRGFIQEQAKQDG